MLNRQERVGCFTSSQIHKLIKSGRGGEIFSAVGKTYIKERKFERLLGRSNGTNPYTQAIAWGHIMEQLCYSKLELAYTLCSDETTAHHDPEYAEFWKGTQDYIIQTHAIAEQKSYQLKKAAEYSDCLMQKDIELFKNEFPEEYWQIVSNACINNVKLGEAISYIPYRADLENLRDKMQTTDILEHWGFGEELWKYRFIIERDIYDLPWIEEGGYFKDITRFRFLIPVEDMEILSERVKLANEQCN